MQLLVHRMAVDGRREPSRGVGPQNTSDSDLRMVWHGQTAKRILFCLAMAFLSSERLVNVVNAVQHVQQHLLNFEVLCFQVDHVCSPYFARLHSN